MDTYSLFRQIADSWVLLAMFVFFGGCVLWAFRPGSRAQHNEAAGLIFRSDATPGCSNACASCSCKTNRDVIHD